MEEHFLQKEKLEIKKKKQEEMRKKLEEARKIKEEEERKKKEEEERKRKELEEIEEQKRRFAEIARLKKEKEEKERKEKEEKERKIIEEQKELERKIMEENLRKQQEKERMMQQDNWNLNIMNNQNSSDPIEFSDNPYSNDPIQNSVNTQTFPIPIKKEEEKSDIPHFSKIELTTTYQKLISLNYDKKLSLFATLAFDGDFESGKNCLSIINQLIPLGFSENQIKEAVLVLGKKCSVNDALDYFQKKNMI